MGDRSRRRTFERRDRNVGPADPETLCDRYPAATEFVRLASLVAGNTTHQKLTGGDPDVFKAIDGL